MAAKGTKRTKSTKGVQPINTPWWAPGWGGNRANVPVRGPNVTYFNPPTIPTWTPPANVPPMSPGYGGSWMPTPEAIAPPSETTGTLPTAMPQYPMYGPPVPGSVGTGGIPETSTPQAQQALPEGYQYPYWLEEREGRPAYSWQNVNGQIQLMPNEDAFPGAPVPPEGWTSAYSPEFYSTQQRNPLTAIWGGSNKGTMGTRGWRRPGSFYMPEQQVKRAGDKVWAERPDWDRRTRWDKFLEEQDEKPAGNNNMKTIPAWVGSLVSWRT